MWGDPGCPCRRKGAVLDGSRLQVGGTSILHHWTLQLLYTSVHIGAWDVSRSLHLLVPGVGRES
jgi:hypothetical protein